MAKNFFATVDIGMVAKELGGELAARTKITGRDLLETWEYYYPKATKDILGKAVKVTELLEAYEMTTSNWFSQSILLTRFGHRNRYEEYSIYKDDVSYFLDNFIPVKNETPVTNRKSVQIEKPKRKSKHPKIERLLEEGVLVTADILASSLGISTRSVYRKTDKFPTVREGKRVLFFRPELSEV